MVKKLYRSRTDSMIAGVCGGLAEYFNIDSTLVRLAAVALTLAGGTGVLAYIIFWIVIPQKPLTERSGEIQGETSEQSTDESAEEEKEEKKTGILFVGVILTILGFLLLVNNFISLPWFSFSRLWPIVLIVIGIIIVLKGAGSKTNES